MPLNINIVWDPCMYTGTLYLYEHSTDQQCVLYLFVVHVLIFTPISHGLYITKTTSYG